MGDREIASRLLDRVGGLVDEAEAADHQHDRRVADEAIVVCDRLLGLYRDYLTPAQRKYVTRLVKRLDEL